MLSAQEAREELEKEPIDRVSDKQLEEMKLATQMFSAELEEEISEKIEKALLANKTQCSLSYHIFSYTREGYSWWNINDSIQHSYGLFEKDGKLDASTVLERAFNKMIKEVVETQADELIELGYFVVVTYSDEHFTDILLKDNNVEITIGWDVKKPMKEQDEEPEQIERRAPYVKASIVEQDDYSKWGTNAQSQSELKELSKKKKKWWERLI